ncbi:putative zinc-type alcohol dehydrogenase-like protein [Hyaloscypha variabilis F]|uniref:Putative zinc-type alcohol dehydrogenase-like protein n=1 Tax=Hyaloscypha variabilis (strain UAMH 11265 / GT02V1 / F) TaxID=1149755 RepID=A0A2J6QVJ6_HYAVF|nr:putative zinc-type alcohol dehydrogenase-like protein [Hyaloscypha variabilis F]
MSTHLVFRLQGKESHRNLKQFEEPKPVIDKYEVLVKVRGISLNYRDIVIASGGYPFPTKDNGIPTSDAAGEVVEVGSSVEGLEVGDHVIGNFDVSNLYGQQKDWLHAHGGPIDGMLRQYITLPGHAVVKIPKHAKLNFTEMASLVCTGTTAWNALYGIIPLKPGQTVLFQVKEKYGPDRVINYKTTPYWAAEAKRITGGRGVDHVFENGGSGTIKQSIDCIVMGGIISVIGFLSDAKQEDMPDVAGLALSKGCIVRGITVGSKQLLEDMVRFVVNRELRPPVDKVFGFSTEEVIAAYDYLQSGAHIGKVCISLD